MQIKHFKNLKKKKKNRAGGMAQGAGPVFKLQDRKKKKAKSLNQLIQAACQVGLCPSLLFTDFLRVYKQNSDSCNSMQAKPKPCPEISPMVTIVTTSAAQSLQCSCLLQPLLPLRDEFRQDEKMQWK
jgi:hypothetical protein